MKKRSIGFRRKHVRKLFKELARRVTREMQTLERDGYTNVSFSLGNCKMDLFMEKGGEFFTRSLGPLGYKDMVGED